jgi:flavin reductase (DIM6/NTAB) family NADH-FMN oxidoreductase RutF
MPETTAPSPLARALGRVPTGLYVVATRDGDEPLGFIGSFLMQQGFDPPTLSVAVGKGRAHLAAMRASGRFAVSILDGESSGAMGPFFKKYEGGETAFDHVATTESPCGLPVLSEALAWMECELTGEFETGDHVVVFGTVTDGATLREGDPSVHLRKNGLGY